MSRQEHLECAKFTGETRQDLTLTLSNEDDFQRTGHAFSLLDGGKKEEEEERKLKKERVACFPPVVL